jgi:hypothetical protein
MAKTIVKHWFGSSNKPKKADYTEFKTKKEAVKHIEQMKRYHKHHSQEMMDAANFYELFKKQSQ